MAASNVDAGQTGVDDNEGGGKSDGGSEGGSEEAKDDGQLVLVRTIFCASVIFPLCLGHAP